MLDQPDMSLAVADRKPSITEVWWTIPGSQGYYSVSSLGRVRSEPIQTSRMGRQRGRVLRCHYDSKGYPQFAMSLPGGHRKTMKAHSAVALAFLGARPPGAQINHISGDKNDNSVTNLEYVSCRRNVRHAWENGLRTADQLRGERHGMAKLTADQVREIRSSYGQVTAPELARRFGVTAQCICLVLKRKTWRHVA